MDHSSEPPACWAGTVSVNDDSHIWAQRPPCRLADLQIDLVCPQSISPHSLLLLLQKAGGKRDKIQIKESLTRLRPDCDIAVMHYVPEHGMSPREAVPRTVDLDVAVIVISDDEQLEQAIRFVGQGVQDYLSHSELTPAVLRKSIVHAVERHALRHILHKQNRRLQTIIESNADGLLVISSDGDIKFVNPAAVDLLGHSADKLVGSPFGFPVVSGEHAEIELRNGNGLKKIVELRVADIHWEDAPALLLALRDISLRKQAEAEAEQYRRRVEGLTTELSQTEERERRRLARILHDDLQQTLVAARMAVDMAASRLDGGEVLDDLQQTNELINEAVKTSRSLTSELTPTILDDLGLVPALDWLCRLQNERYGLDVTLNGNSNISIENEDLRGFLFQAVRELLFNVVKHAGSAPIALTVGRTRTDQIEIVVEDKGPGFDPEEIEKRNEDNGGFGLFHIKQRIQHFDGELHIESKPGDGSRFILVVPNAAPHKKADHQESNQQAKGPIRLLLIDDARAVRHLFTRMLSKDHQVDVVGSAASAEEGLRLAEQLTPDVILTDVSLPDMPGPDVVRKLHQQLPESRIIGLSMHDPRDVAESMTSAGAECYLRKDQPIEEILKVVLAADST